MNTIIRRGIMLHIALLVAAALILTGCGDSRTEDTPTDVEPVAETAQIEATSIIAEPAAEATAYPLATASAATLPASQQETVETETTPPDTPAELVSVTPPGAPTGALPGIVTRARLAEPPAILRDLRYDEMSNRVFVTTSDSQLIVLDAAEFREEARFAFGGDLTLDAENRRLYAAPGESYIPEGETPVIHIIDADSLTEIGKLEGGRFLSLDTAGRRVFTGSPVTSYEEEGDQPDIAIYDLDTLEGIGRIDQPGVPVYNPLRDELVVTAYTVYTVDPDSGEILRDLLPELQEQPFAWCNGCEMAEAAHVFAAEGLLVVERNKIATGAGAGIYPEPLYFDAATLEPLEAPERRPSLQFTCGSQPMLLPPIDGRILRQPYFIRYLVYRNFTVHGLDGQEITWRDGLFAPYVNPRTGQAYVTQGYVLDLATLTPVGRIPEFCPLAIDEAQGRIFGRSEGELLVIDERGGMPLSPPPTEPDALPAAPVLDILISPGYPADPTVFVLLESGRVYRTEDDGLTWTRNQGGLPRHDNLTLSLSLSPDFTADRTIFAGGFVGDYQGEGVLRSTDAGDTWEPVWQGLEHLRVYDLRVSPEFATDGRIHAFARYQRISPWEAGVSLWESTDRGLSWTQVMTAASESELALQAASAWSAAPDDLPVRLAGYGQSVEVRPEGAETWETLDLGQSEDQLFRAVAPSPTFETDGTLYVLGESGLWRTTDRGASWQRWDDPRLQNRTYENALFALAVSPALPDGSHKLFVGSFAGEFWALTPSEAAETRPGSEAAAEEPLLRATATPAPPPVDVEAPTPPELPDEPPEGAYRPSGPLASLWEASDQTKSDLGYALQETSESIPAAYQSFEHGTLIWRGDNLSILALFDDGSWKAFPDTWEEGEPEFDLDISAPDGLQQPMRGFGKVWRTEEEVQARLGWALDKEQGYSAFVHSFERGFLMGSPVGARVFVEVGDEEGRWY
ncbi:MAG: hypothetical protein QM346_11280 [Chloroflexota bacterium]|nr:hypothetical protein [Chloroflexota bacterium]